MLLYFRGASSGGGAAIEIAKIKFFLPVRILFLDDNSRNTSIGTSNGYLCTVVQEVVFTISWILLTTDSYFMVSDSNAFL